MLRITNMNGSIAEEVKQKKKKKKKYYGFSDKLNQKW